MGRPRKNPVAGSDEFDPADLDGQIGNGGATAREAGAASADTGNPDAAAAPVPGEGTGAKRRGRPPGGGNKRGPKNKADLAASIEQLSRTVFYMHLGLGAALAPELALSEDECKAVTSATVNLMDAFDVKPDPRVEAVMGFAFTVGPIYATKAFQIRNRRNKERAERRKAAQPGAGPVAEPMATARVAPEKMNGSGSTPHPAAPIDFTTSPLGGGGSDERH